MAGTTVPRQRHNGIWRIKPVDLILQQGEDLKQSLKRTLGPLSITAMGIGAIVGTGIFVLTGVAAANYAGPGLILSFIAAGIASGLAAICYAEFASSIPISGSAYTYSYATLGEVIAWIIGWDLVLEYAVGAATVSIGWAGYFTDLFGGILDLKIPPSLTASPFSGGIINLPAVIIILLITALLVRGTAQSSTINNIIVGIKLLVILFFIIIGVGHINPANWHPFLPFGPAGIFHGAGIIFFAYIGFDQISTSAEETRNPARDLPLGILLSLSVCTILYIAVTAVLTGMVSYTQLNVASPVSHALILIGLKTAGSIISVGAICGLTTVLIVLLYGQSRIFFSMSRDGLLPKVFSHVHSQISHSLLIQYHDRHCSRHPGGIHTNRCTRRTNQHWHTSCIHLSISRRPRPETHTTRSQTCLPCAMDAPTTHPLNHRLPGTTCQPTTHNHRALLHLANHWLDRLFSIQQTRQPS